MTTVCKRLYNNTSKLPLKLSSKRSIRAKSLTVGLINVVSASFSLLSTHTFATWLLYLYRARGQFRKLISNILSRIHAIAHCWWGWQFMPCSRSGSHHDIRHPKLPSCAQLLATGVLVRRSRLHHFHPRCSRSTHTRHTYDFPTRSPRVHQLSTIYRSGKMPLLRARAQQRTNHVLFRVARKNVFPVPLFVTTSDNVHAKCIWFVLSLLLWQPTFQVR